MKKYLYIFIVSLLCNFKLFAQQADVIFTNANIITAAQKGARANAMAIKDGKILFVGEVKKLSKGKADPKITTQLLEAQLSK